jgi:hypothetical protein
MPVEVEEEEALLKRHHNQAIKEAWGSIRWGFISLAIGGGLWLATYEDWLPQGFASALMENQAGFFVFIGMAVVLVVLGYLSLRAHRTGTERAHRQLTMVTLIITGIGVFIGAVLAAMFISISIVLPLEIDDRFFYVIGAVVWVAIWLLVTISYFWRRAWSPTTAPTFFGHVGWSAGIVLFGSLAVFGALFFGYASAGFVRGMQEGAAAESLAVVAIMPALAISLFAFAIWSLWGWIKRN